ncbi:MAG TPA: hypothetical protein VHS96_12490 [Bacteroidia bacterium]|nr:hypothetical protein [Bacteroidia bacterium]
MKNSEKLEDIDANSGALIQLLTQSEKDAGLALTLETWNHVLDFKPIMAFLV